MHLQALRGIEYTGREGEMEGGRERGKEGGRERGRERGREGEREGGREREGVRACSVSPSFECTVTTSVGL